MKFLKPWLQEYIVETLPEDSVIVTTLNKKAFEVEEIITTEQGTVFDIKVLPNRAHDSLGHHGMAFELCASLGLTFKKDIRVKDSEAFYDKHIETPQVTIVDEMEVFEYGKFIHILDPEGNKIELWEPIN